MNREEAKQKLWSYGNINTISKDECNQLIKEIYDYFELMTCENCEHSFEYMQNCFECNLLGYVDSYSQTAYIEVSKDFGCIAFKRK